MNDKIKALVERIKKNGWTTLIGVCEATLLSVGAETLFDLTNKQRSMVFGMAFLRAAFAALASDAKKDKPDA